MSWDANDISVRERILRGFAACLAGEGTPAANVYRSKLDQVQESDLPCYDVVPGTEKDDSSFQDHEAWGRLLTVNLRVLVDATGTDDSALDPLYLWAVRRIIGDPALSALAEVEWTGVEPVFRPFGKDIIGAELMFDVKFSVARGDPAQKG